MKLTILFLAFSLQVSAAAFAQDISLNFKNANLREVLQSIRKQSGYSFVVDGNDLKKANPVNITLKTSSIETTLHSLFENQPFIYKVEGKLIMIRLKEAEKKTTGVAKDDKTVDIKGTVTDEDGKPLSGATVIVKGTQQGAVTNHQGQFSLADVPENGTLIVRMVGRESKEITYKNGVLPSISLREVNADLKEIQIIAYGEVDKKFVTSNIGSISGEQISKQPVTNPLLAMQARVPGLFIQQTSGNTLGNVNVLIQGRNSIRNGIDPFYVVDGIPYLPNMPGSSLAGSNFPTNAAGSGGSAFNFINPADIESVEILKDADATAIYGSRAANGAILITTKRGKAGRTKVDLNIQSGWGKIARRAAMLNTSQYLELRKEAYANDNLPIPTATTNPANSNFDLTIWDPNKSHDWQEELVGGTANFTNIQASISGGSEFTQFLLSTGYNRQSTVFPTDLADRKYNVHVNLNHSSENRKFNMNFTSSFLQSNNTLPSIDLMGRAVSLAPNAPDLYNADGSLNWGAYPNSPNQFSFLENPAAVLLRKYTGLTNNLLANALLSYEVLPGLQLKSTFGYNMLLSDEVLITPIASLAPNQANRTATSNFIDKSTHSYIVEPQLTFDKHTDWGHINLLLGTTFQQSKSEVTGYSASGFSNDNQLSNISAATTIISSNSDLQNLYKYNAFFGRVNYRLKDKYILNINLRRDGSSRFGANNKFHNFYSVGAAWLFADETGLKQKLPFISSGKFRANYGSVGNDQLTDYAYESLLQSTPFGGMPYQNTTSIRPFRHSNPDLQWEETRKLNIGLDVGVFDERISFSGNYFYNRSSNQLISYILPAMTGFAGVEMNFPATIQNTGVELLLNLTPIKNSNFEWTMSANATIPRNKLVYFKDFDKSSFTTTYVIGEPVNILPSKYIYAGLDPNTGLYQFQTAKGEITSRPSALTDRISFVNTNPKWYGGISNTFRYRNLDLDFLFQYVNQIGQNDRFISGIGRIHVNVPMYVYENRWRTPGQETDVEKVSNNILPSRGFANNSTAKFSDASYLRLKNVSLSYNLPEEFIRKTGLQSARVYAQAQNLFTFTKFRGIDPENTSFTSLPPLKMFTGGLQITF